VDGQSLEAFEKDLKGNLYKIWNRMSSGAYFPPAVRGVEIPKQHGGGTRMLGIPTVADRVAQIVVARHLTARVEPVFHLDSYGYRPGRSAHHAVERCRERCWRKDWVIDLDIQKFFDSVRWDLIVKAVEAHTDAAWVVLYVKRWLKAPIQMPDGSVQQRDRGTPQGSAVSPVLANLFMHYAFDAWLAREFPTVQFERSPTTRSCTASARVRPSGCWPRSGTGWPRSGCGCIPTRPGSCIAGTSGGGAHTSAHRSPSWGSRSASAGRGEGTAGRSGGSCRDQQGRPEEDQPGNP
jgi:retron-type reverse transcriptase